MVNAFSHFVQEQAAARRWRQRDLLEPSKLSRQVVSKYMTDKRDVLGRLPDKETVAGFARAFGVSPDFLLGKAIEALGLGYSSGDFINGVETASNRDLLAEIERRLMEGGQPAVRPALSVVPPKTDDAVAAHEEEGSIAGEQEQPTEP